MPRSGGTYTLPSPPTPFVNGTTANAPDVNTVLNDIASALTDSVAADGQTPMTGALNMNNQNITAANGVTAKSITLGSSALSLVMRGLINGLTLSNDATLPNTVLDISAGTCVDSTNASFITLAAFTKNIGGSWTAGSGSNGMGVGLTATLNTWYHVFAIINASTPDIYFDTSVTAANAPVGTSAFRRIGSIKLDGSAHIGTFVQVGDYFVWGAPPATDINDTTLGTGAKLYTLSSSPPGVSVMVHVRLNCVNSGAAAGFAVGSPFETTLQGNSLIAPSATLTGADFFILTNTSAQIQAKSSQPANNTIVITVPGWMDYRGRFF